MPKQRELFSLPVEDAPEGRVCRDCGFRKPISAFKRHSQSPNFPYPSCKGCDRRHDLLVASTDYRRLVERQGGEFCAICSDPPNGRRLQIDVDRRTWTVRGLLCFNCNSGLGKFRHDALLLASAIEYVDECSPVVESEQLTSGACLDR